MTTKQSTLRLAIAGIVFHIQLPLDAWLTPLAARYRSFLAEPAPGLSPVWQVILVHATAESAGAPWIAHDEAITRFAIADFNGWIDLAGQCAQVNAVDADRAASAIDRVLAYICMQVLPRQRAGLLLHGAALVWRGIGLAFCGPSGAGKTTVAQLAEGYADVLTDETLVISLTGLDPMLLSTPFWGASTPPALIQRVNHQAPLRALFLLEHAPTFALLPLDASPAVLALLATEKVATERVSSATAWLDMASELVSRVPVYRLRFLPTPELWQFLAAHLQKASLM